MLFLIKQAMEGCLKLQPHSSKEDVYLTWGFSSYVSKHSGPLNSGCAIVSHFAAISVFPKATPAGSIRTSQLITEMTSTQFMWALQPL